MSLLSPFAARPVVVVPRGRGGFRRGVRRRRVFYMDKDQSGIANTVPAAEAAGSAYDSDGEEDARYSIADLGDEYDSADEYDYEDTDAAGDEFYDSVDAMRHAPAAAAEIKGNHTEFIASILSKHGMLEGDAAAADSHPSSKKLIPLDALKTNKAGCAANDADVIVLDCVVVDPDNNANCDGDGSESSSSSSDEDCKETGTGEVPCVPSDDGDLALDLTPTYECWVSRGTTVYKKDCKQRPGPDDCDEKPAMDVCAQEAAIKASFQKAMQTGSAFRGKLKSLVRAIDSSGNSRKPIEQKVALDIKGGYKDGAYLVKVKVTPFDAAGAPISKLAAEARLVKIKLDANGAFKARPIKSGTAKLLEQRVPLAAVQHAVLVVQDMLQK